MTSNMRALLGSANRLEMDYEATADELIIYGREGEKLVRVFTFTRATTGRSFTEIYVGGKRVSLRVAKQALYAA